MPLDAEAEPCVRLFDGLHDAVLAQRGEGEAGGDPVHGLMVLAVDEHGVLPQNAGKQGAPADGDGVDFGPVVVVRQMFKGLDVLIQVAAQHGIHDLDAPADAQHRFVCGQKGAQQQRLGCVAEKIRLAAGGDARLPVELRVHVAAAGQQQTIAGQGVLHRLFGVAQLDPAHPGSGASQTFNVFGLCHGRLRVGAHPRHGDHNTHIQLPHCLQPLPANAESGCLCKKRGIARSARSSPFGRTVCEADEEGRPAGR